MSITFQIIICILIADFLTGLIHFLEDTYCTKKIPLIGTSICVPNIDHHKFPKLMLEGANLIRTNYQSFLLAMFVFFIFWAFGLFFWQLLVIGVVASFGNQVHLWNHQTKSSYWVQFLKDSGLIQSQKQHSLHHIPPYNTNYCTLLSFNNAWLDRINFWAKLETFIEKILKIKTKRLTEQRDFH